MSETIMVSIPADQEWPVVGRDESGHLLLRQGFVEAVCDASGLSLAWHGDPALPRITNDGISELLITWYIERLKQGYPRCPIMDSYFLEICEEDGIAPFLPIFFQDTGTAN